MKFAVILLLIIINFVFKTNAQDNLDLLLNKSFKELSEIKISSSTKQLQSLSEIPNSVTIITRKEIELHGYRTLEEILKHAPGLYIIDNTEDNLLGIRGNTFASILFLQNGFPLHPNRIKGSSVPTRSFYNIPVGAIDRIEITRGPQSVIYGNNAFLGSINIVTNESHMNGNMISSGYGEQDNGQGFGRVAEEFGELKLVINSGFYNNGGLQGKYSDLMSPTQFASVNPNMHSDLDSQLKHRYRYIDLSLSLKNWELFFKYSQMQYGFYISTPGVDEGNILKLSNWIGALKYENSISKNWKLRWTLINSKENYNLFETDFLLPNQDWFQRQKSSRLESEINLIYDSPDNYSWLLGARYQRLYDIRNKFDFSPFLTGDSYTDPNNSFDIFSQISYLLTQKFRLVAGTRLSYTSDFNSYEIVNDDRFNFGTAKARTSINLAGIYTIDERQILKLIYSEATQDNRVRRLSEPEEIKSLELAYTYNSHHFNIGLSLFRNDTDKVARLVIQNLTVISDNTGHWITDGVELSGNYLLNDQLNFFGSLTWQKTRDRNNPLSPGNSPELLGKLGMNYEWTKRFNSSMYLNYVSSIEPDWTISGTTPQRIGKKVDDYMTVGVNMRYEFDSGWYMNLNASNLFDKKYRHPASELVDFEGGLSGEGRIIYFSVGCKF